jgi:hypothetical protein
MKKVLAISSVLFGVVFLAGCGQQPVSQTQQPTTPTPAVQQPSNSVSTPSPVNQPITTANWKTYNSKVFGISVSVPNDWKEVMPGDRSLTELNDNSFEGYTVISSPDKKETMVFINKPVDFNSDCQQKDSNIGNLKIKEVTCSNSTEDQIPGRYNYEFIDKNLVIILNEKTDTTNKVISSIK